MTPGWKGPPARWRMVGRIGRMSVGTSQAQARPGRDPLVELEEVAGGEGHPLAEEGAAARLEVVRLPTVVPEDENAHLLPGG